MAIMLPPLTLKPYQPTTIVSIANKIYRRRPSSSSLSLLTQKLTKRAYHVSSAARMSNNRKKKMPVLLFDVMDTIVTDPFYHHIPAFFGMSMKELLDCKHPTAWIEFEKGLIDEVELERIFFTDGRKFDLEGLKSCMLEAYSYIEGVEELLCTLKDNGYEMHAFTNYPIWYRMIEEKLKLSSYLSWTFCSCTFGKRKPDPLFYAEVLKHLDIEPQNCVFIDDRMKNVEAAKEAGINGIQFKNADSLQQDLSLLGIKFPSINTQKQEHGL